MKAGCPWCKELFSNGHSSLRHSVICPWITGNFELFDSGDESTVHNGVSLQSIFDNGNEIDIGVDESSGSTVMSDAPLWEDIVISDVTVVVSVLVEGMYSSANEFAICSGIGLTQFPFLKFEPLNKTLDSNVICEFLVISSKSILNLAWVPFECMNFLNKWWNFQHTLQVS